MSVYVPELPPAVNARLEPESSKASARQSERLAAVAEKIPEPPMVPVEPTIVMVNGLPNCGGLGETVTEVTWFAFA